MDRAAIGLSRELPLPPGWSAPEVVDDRVDVGGLTVHRAGVVSRNASGAEVTGSAAEREGSPLRRAWLELLERTAIFDAGDPIVDHPRQRPARSNGVALHETWGRACARARLELAERDRVLRSWYGEGTPEPAEPPQVLRDLSTHEWEACVLGGEAWGDVEVAAVVGFPRDPRVPLARGFAARPERRAAVEAAGREALQSLAFLWDEPVPDRVPELAPTPIYHLDYYLYPAHHAQLRRWLAGEHARYGSTPKSTPACPQVRFVDLTPPGLGGGLRVARAVSEQARPLLFGEPPSDIVAGLPPELHVHPIA